MGRTILILNYPRLGTWALFTLIKDILLFRPQMLCQSLLEKPADTNIPNSPCGISHLLLVIFLGDMESVCPYVSSLVRLHIASSSYLPI